MTNLQKEPQTNLDEMRGIVAHLPPFDLAASSHALAASAGLPPFFAELAAWAAGSAAKYPFSLRHGRCVLFAGNHAHASTAEREQTAKEVKAYGDGKKLLCQAAKKADADLRLYEMALEHPAQDSRFENAMGDESAAQAMAYGMMAVEAGVDIISLSAIGAGTELAARLLASHMGREALFLSGKKEWQDLPGSLPRGADFFTALSRFGGAELAGVAGTLLASAMGRVPVILDGLPALLTAYAFAQQERRIADHCWPAAYPPGAIGDVLQNFFQKKPLQPSYDNEAGVAGALSLSLFEILGAHLS